MEVGARLSALIAKMYLVSLFEEEAVVEASLGGRVTYEEARVFGDELMEMVSAFTNRPFYMLLDFSKAVSFDDDTISALSVIKDRCFGAGAVKIVSVPQHEQEMVRQTGDRLQNVLEGREEFTLDPTGVQFPTPERAAIHIAA